MVKRMDFYCVSYVFVKNRQNSLLKSGNGTGVIGSATAIRTRLTGSRMPGSGWDWNPFLSGTPVGRPWAAAAPAPQPRRLQPGGRTLTGDASPTNATDGSVPVIRSSLGPDRCRRLRPWRRRTGLAGGPDGWAAGRPGRARRPGEQPGPPAGAEAKRLRDAKICRRVRRPGLRLCFLARP
jgi:hypothetical protein